MHEEGRRAADISIGVQKGPQDGNVVGVMAPVVISQSACAPLEQLRLGAARSAKRMRVSRPVTSSTWATG